MPTPRRAPLAVLPLLAAALCGQGGGDALGLGKMWTFERPPLGYLQREYGFRPDQQWLRSVQLASLRFGQGCSASFVSPQGLILTNHHCVRDALARVQGERDLVRDGFVAAGTEDELRLPGLVVQQLVRTTEVSAQVEAGVVAAMTPMVQEMQRRQNQDRLLAEAAARAPGLRPQLVRLFHGAVWQLYEYRVFDDVRLVMAPELQAAQFGGDPDNFTYPRYAVDFAFCRAYVDGRPADTTASYFAWSHGPRENDLVFLTGNPAATQRLLGKAQLEYLAEVRYPRLREMVDARIAILQRAAADPRLEKRYRTVLLGLENARKLYQGEHAALRDPQFLARKAAAEAAMQARLQADPALRADCQGLWTGLVAVAQRRERLDARLAFHSAGGSPLLLRALLLLDVAAGDDGKRREAEAVPCEADPLATAWFVDHLQRAAGRLPADDPWLRAVLGGATPAAAAAALERDSRLGDGAVVAALLRGGREAIQASDDRALQIARAIRPQVLAARAAWSEVDAEERQLASRLARALFSVYGDEVSPEATQTLRFSDGRVLGYECNGTRAPWRTVFGGLFARAAEFEGRPPFDLAPAFVAHRDRIAPETAVNFVCTVDATGGNSGSPVIAPDRRLVGLLFDGNIESLGNEFLYSERVARSVCVHPDAIATALSVYGAARVLAELRATLR